MSCQILFCAIYLFFMMCLFIYIFHSFIHSFILSISHKQRKQISYESQPLSQLLSKQLFSKCSKNDINPCSVFQERDGHDWYCFDCHQPGEVLLCSTCWRVYHPTCTDEEWTSVDAFVCNICAVRIYRSMEKRWAMQNTHSGFWI